MKLGFIGTGNMGGALARAAAKAEDAYLLLYDRDREKAEALLAAVGGRGELSDRPAEGAELLATVWLGYRKAYPRLDGTLCEWLPDYCMIHGIALPERIGPILPEIVPKAQLKEFYLDRASSDPVSFARDTVRLLDRGPFQIFGGCCGTDGRHLKQTARLLQRKEPS